MKPSSTAELLEFDPLTTLPGEDRVLARSGCPPSRSGRFGGEAREALELLALLARPKALTATMPVREITSDLVRGEGIVLHSSSLARFMREAEMVTVFLVTVGPGPERECRSLQELGQISRAFFLDSSASCMVEEVSRAVQRRLAEGMHDFRPTGRFAPGFGDFPLSAQAGILELLDGERAGVRLQKESFMLVPVKSGTGVIGWIRRSS